MTVNCISPKFCSFFPPFISKGIASFDISIDSQVINLKSLKHKQEYTVPFLNLNGIEVKKGWFWDSIILETNIQQNPFHSTRLRKRRVKQILNEIYTNWAQAYLYRYKKDIVTAYAELQELLSSQKYIAHSDLAKFIQTWPFLNILPKLNTLSSKEVFTTSAVSSHIQSFIDFLNSSQIQIDASNEKFIKHESIKYKDFFDTIESNPLTEKQTEAVIANEDTTLVIAGAGSGKTSVIVAKVAYLVKKGLAKPEEILLLAFAKDAKEEMAQRIKKRLKITLDVQTFHSFGLNVLGLVSKNKPTLDKSASDPREYRQIFIDAINELKKEDGQFCMDLIHFIAGYGKEYKTMFNFTTAKAHREYLHELRSLKGERLKSYEEIIIANFFFLNGINYVYEKPYKYRTATFSHRQYEPDFYLPDYDIYLEHFAIRRNGSTPPFINKKSYNKGINWKRHLHEKNRTKLIETYSYENFEGCLLKNLKSKLRRVGVNFGPVDTKEILEQITHAPQKIAPMAELLGIFLQHFKSGQHTIENLKTKVSDYHETLFLNIFQKVLKKYQKHLANNTSIDFNDMIIQAEEYISTKKYKSPYKYILVDEYQDIAASRAHLVRGLLKNRPGSKMIGVGDDWQSIFRFAGSDLNLMINFEKFFGPSKTIYLDKTFRFNNHIANLATRFITKNPLQLKKTINAAQITAEPAFTIIKEFEGGINKAFRLIKERRKGGENVFVLGRYKFNEPKGLRQLIKTEKIKAKFCTAHGAKGLEADYVVIVGLSAGRSGFPSQRENDPLLSLVLSQKEEFADAEERRLFYTCLTRAKKHVYLIEPNERSSTFVAEVKSLLETH